MPYLMRKKIMDVISHVALGHSEYRHPFMETREVKRAGYIIVTTNRGLCGGLNSNLLKAVLKDIKQKIDAGIEVDLCLIGSKLWHFFNVWRQYCSTYSSIGDSPAASDFIGVVKVMLDAYLAKRIDALYVCSIEFINTMRQEPHIQQVLPLCLLITRIFNTIGITYTNQTMRQPCWTAC